MKKNKIAKRFGVLVFALMLTFSSTMPSYAAVVDIINEEIESNDAVGDENYFKIGSYIIGRINVPNDVDRYIFVGVGNNVNYLFIKQSADNTDYYTYIFDQTANKYIKPLSVVSGDNEQLTFKAEAGHMYIFLVNANTISQNPYSFMFY